MSESKSWAEITHKIELSGQKAYQKYKQETLERNKYFQQEWQQQMSESVNRRKQINSQKPNERVKAEKMDEVGFERQRKIKEQMKQKEKILQIENMKIANDQVHSKIRQNPNLFKQNPMTANIFQKFQQRKKKTRQINQQYNSINSQLIGKRAQITNQLKNIDIQKGKQFSQHIQSQFKKIDEQRQTFKLNCLNPSFKKKQRSVTLPDGMDSLEKQYAIYLQQQIQQNKKYKNISNDQIDSPEVSHINSKVQNQSSSPAYLGRIPYNHDRVKQLSYLNKHITNNSRIKTEQNPYEERQKLNRTVNSHNIQQNSYISQKNPPQNHQPQQPRITKKQPEVKLYKQYNILTGGHIYRPQYLQL